MKGVDVDLKSANPHREIETTSPDFQPQVTTTITLHKHSYQNSTFMEQLTVFKKSLLLINTRDDVETSMGRASTNPTQVQKIWYTDWN